MIETNPTDPRISRYSKEYTRWLNVLQNYHQERFTKNYQQYTAYTSTRGTHAKISDPIAPELTERVIQKLFSRDPNFLVMAQGRNLPKEIVDIMQSVAGYFWTNPDQIRSSGSLRQKLKVGGREFCITGNMITETYYNAQADSPDFRIWPVEDCIFNPSMTLKTSNRYYFRQYVSSEYLESMVEEKDADGKTVKGIFKEDAVRRVIASYKGARGTMKSDPTPNQVMRSGNGALTPHVEDILMVTCWNPVTLDVCRICDWSEIIQDTNDPLGIGVFPFDFAMDIEIPKEPYGFGFLDFIAGVTQAKDLFLNQIIDYGSRALNPPLFVDPQAPAINKMTLRNAFQVGGIVFASPKDAQHAVYPPLPSEGFELLTYLQQRAEGVTGISPYLSGVPNATNDKTKGTAAGIAQLTSQAGSPIADRQQNIEESIVEPILNKFFKLAASLMGHEEERFVFISGQNSKWVQITKGMLNGKITLQDLVTIGLVANTTPLDPVSGKPAFQPDPQTQQPPQNPKTGFLLGSEADQLAMMMVAKGENPKSKVVYDADWVVNVETGSMAEQDEAKDIANFQSWTAYRVQYRIPTDFAAISQEMGMRMGIKNPDQYDLDPTEEGNAAPFDLPKISVHYNDLPVAGRIQVAKNMGVTLTEQDFQNMGMLPDTTPQGLSPMELSANTTLKPQQPAPLSEPVPAPPMPGMAR